MDTTAWRAAIVVGASSGIGEAVARRLAADGVPVALVARREDALRRIAAEITAATASQAPRTPAAPGAARVAVRAHDVRRGDDVPELWQSIERELGPVDLLVFASGVMPAVGASEYTFAKDRDILETNLLGAVAWFDEAAVRMEAARRGTIVGVSSIAGDRGRRGAPAYATSKAAMNTFLESLRNRLGRFGVAVVTARMGYVATPMTSGLGLPARATVSADRAADLILRRARKGPADVHLPRAWALVGLVIRSIPSFVFRRLSI